MTGRPKNHRSNRRKKVESFPIVEPNVVSTENKYRISGHESFPCRYAWLPKVVRLIQREPALLNDEEKSMVEMGLGKNMVRSARFWGQAAGMIKVIRSGIALTETGDLLLGKGRLDPFLEDIRTLWLLHWHLSTNMTNPLLAWDYLLNKWQEPELVHSSALRILYKEASKFDAGLSINTLHQHLDVFLHSYIPTRGKKGIVLEDNLDCPLVELELLQKVGDRESSLGESKYEAIYVFRRDEKPEITQELFLYCLADYWVKRYPTERTLAFRDIAHGHGSPGQVFKLPEEDVRARLEIMDAATLGCFVYVESAQLQQVRMTEKKIDRKIFLKNIYAEKASHVN